MEQWKQIEGSNGYEVSSEGRVRSTNYLGHGKTQILALNPDQKGYLRVRIYFGSQRKTCKVHRLVAQAFIPNPEMRPEVNHKNGVKTKNYVENLEWTSSKENTLHAYKTGLKEKTREHCRRLGNGKGKKALAEVSEKRKIPVVAVNKATGEETLFPSAADAGRMLGIPQPNIWKVLNGHRKSAGGYIFVERR